MSGESAIDHRYLSELAADLPHVVRRTKAEVLSVTHVRPDI